MGALTTDGLTLMLNWMFTTTAVTRPVAWTISLHTADPGATGAANEVVVGTDADYVRQSVTYADEASGRCLSDSSVSWTVNAASGGYTVTHAAVWSGSVCLMKGALLIPRVLVANDVLTFGIGEIVAALD